MDFQTLKVLLDSLTKSQASQEVALKDAITHCAEVGAEYDRAKKTQTDAQTALDATKAARRGVEMAMQTASEDETTAEAEDDQ